MRPAPAQAVMAVGGFLLLGLAETRRQREVLAEMVDFLTSSWAMVAQATMQLGQAEAAAI